MDRLFYGFITAEALSLFSLTHIAAARPAVTRHMYLEKFFLLPLDKQY
jgi:hypothetical protein